MSCGVDGSGSQQQTATYLHADDVFSATLMQIPYTDYEVAYAVVYASLFSNNTAVFGGGLSLHTGKDCLDDADSCGVVSGTR